MFPQRILGNTEGRNVLRLFTHQYYSDNKSRKRHNRTEEIIGQAPSCTQVQNFSIKCMQKNSQGYQQELAVIKNNCCLERARYNSHHLHGSLQPSVTLVSGIPVPFCGLHQCAYIHACKILIKIKFFKKNTPE